MLVLDTDILSIVQRAAGTEYARLVARLPAEQEKAVWITVISMEEQSRGWLAYLAKARTSEERIEAYARFHGWQRDLARRQLLNFDARAEQEYQDLLAAKVRIGTMDMRIAAIVLANDATLLSRNLRDFNRVPGLRVEDWTRE